MVTSAERPIERFVTPGLSLAFVAATAAGLIKAATAWDVQVSTSSLALAVALASVYTLLGTVGLTWSSGAGRKSSSISCSRRCSPPVRPP
jgi:hypothetical protein